MVNLVKPDYRLYKRPMHGLFDFIHHVNGIDKYKGAFVYYIVALFFLSTFSVSFVYMSVSSE